MPSDSRCVSRVDSLLGYPGISLSYASWLLLFIEFTWYKIKAFSAIIRGYGWKFHHGDQIRDELYLSLHSNLKHNEEKFSQSIGRSDGGNLGHRL